MWLRVLGAGAGGGFPQWNCGCPGCRAVRDGSRPATPRTQSSIAVSADRTTWFLVNASPDLRAQIEASPVLRPGGTKRSGAAAPKAGYSAKRDSPIAAVLLTDAELDHTMGLLLLREGPGVELHATEASLQTLRDGTGFLSTLERYTTVTPHTVVPGETVALGEGLTYTAFDVPTVKKARFGVTEDVGRVVGYRFTDTATGRSAVYLPGVQEVTPAVHDELAAADTVLVDGTTWTDDEMIRLGLASKTARDMGHLAVDGPDGSLAVLAGLPAERKIYVHINNTNPMLLEDSPEYATVAARGVEIALDGLEVEV
ncbi:pyrroloquinoline quinone biosynthesis protein PqqB [Actinomycetospora lutea]|uniref:pyrroloquinoline quinone biosynthesis protein PqqB n=1 Tax=Actinomycetospora lutea TaxID=663604 RepID=UPI002366C49B|nr:pyrroloquinoline quinone biosynthesis protein PqqB [Actinomycetospora lutea]MDD7938933.1 pyrroloquinoline quinone biosynthesis protein PqqB [Actinomycetospora lutea]